MTVYSALVSIVSSPLPANAVLKIAVDRGLSDPETTDYSKEIGESEEFLLAQADIYYWMATSPDMKEQEVSLTQADRKYYLTKANKIYSDYGIVVASLGIYGFTGEKFNA